MAIIESKYRIEPGELGSKRIVQFGRCDGDQATIDEIEARCVRVFQLIQIPNAAGVVLKSLNGVEPTVQEIAPPTMSGKKYNCVKVEGRCGPFAPQQDGGLYEGKTVLQFEIVWQQVGAL